MTLVLGAMDGEIGAYREQLRITDEKRWNGFVFRRGSLDGHPLVVARCGVGKSLSAAVTQHLIDRYHPDRVVFSGLAGALSAELQIGDTLIARDCLQYDLDATALGFALGEVPFSGYRILRCDPALVAAAERFIPHSGTVRSGRVLTGDRFLVDSTTPAYAYLREQLHGDAVDMEGASVALVAALNRVPFLLVRSISDKANGAHGAGLKTLLARASRNSLACVRHILAADRSAAGLNGGSKR